MDQREIDHLEGKHVVVKRTYVNEANDGTATVTTSLPNDEELELWVDAAFTNGGPLVKIELVWSPKEAEALNARYAGQFDQKGD